MISKKILSFLITLFIPHAVTQDLFFNFAIWNTGQGSWSTYITSKACYHFDMGGEKVDFKKISEICNNKQNQILLTHLDWDHIRFISPFTKKLKQVCLFYPKTKTKSWLKRIKPCPKLSPVIKVISFGNDFKSRNAGSIVYLVNKRILITGDAPISEEHKWFRKIPRKIDLLILGHHGSRTSTSVKLLNWSQPRFAIASARKSKYGHPHPNVIKKLIDRKIPLLRTEVLGNLYFLIGNPSEDV